MGWREGGWGAGGWRMGGWWCVGVKKRRQKSKIESSKMELCFWAPGCVQVAGADEGNGREGTDDINDCSSVEMVVVLLGL